MYTECQLLFFKYGQCEVIWWYFCKKNALVIRLWKQCGAFPCIGNVFRPGWPNIPKVSHATESVATQETFFRQTRGC